MTPNSLSERNNRVKASYAKFMNREDRKRMRKRPVMRERQEQQILCEWLETRGIGACSIPNEARRSYRTAAVLKSTGMRAGSPDLILWQLAKDGKPVAVEMKAVDGRVQTTQLEVHAEMEQEGWHIVLAFGAADAIEQLERLGF